MTGPGRAGTAIPIVVLLVLAIAGVAHGALSLAQAELAVSTVAADLLAARAAADGAARRLNAAGWTPEPATGRFVYARVDQGASGKAVYSVDALRLSRELWLVEATAEVAHVRTRVVSLTWAMEPAARAAAVGAVVGVFASGSVAGADRVSSDSALVADDRCVPWKPALDSLALEGVVPVRASGSPVVLGPLTVVDVLDRVPLLLDSADLPDGAFGAIGAAASLSVEAGHAEGVLVVDGDLELSSGAVVEGLVMTSGRLLVRDSSRLHGVALVGGLDVAPTATVLGSLCAASVALAAAREELGRALPLPGPRSLLPG